MKFCHSLLVSSKFIKCAEQLESMILCSALSVAFIHSLGYKIKLYTNDLGKKLLDGIPYDEIIDIDFFDFIPETCYAQSKFAALELMDDDEVHIDYDVFIKSKTCIDLLKASTADVVVQYIYQVGSYKFESSLKAINFFKMLGLIDIDYSIDRIGFNAGIICIKNKKLKKEFINAYKSFYKDGYDVIKQIDKTGFILDSYVEEVQMMDIIQDKKYSVYSLFGDLRNDNEQLSNASLLAETVGYEHYCGPKHSFKLKLLENLKITDTSLYNIVEQKLQQFANIILTNI